MRSSLRVFLIQTGGEVSAASRLEAATSRGVSIILDPADSIASSTHNDRRRRNVEISAGAQGGVAAKLIVAGSYAVSSGRRNRKLSFLLALSGTNGLVNVLGF